MRRFFFGYLYLRNCSLLFMQYLYINIPNVQQILQHFCVAELPLSILNPADYYIRRKNITQFCVFLSKLAKDHKGYTNSTLSPEKICKINSQSRVYLFRPNIIPSSLCIKVFDNVYASDYIRRRRLLP